MSITLISCVDTQFAIGYQNKLLCHLPNDLQHFKKYTQGNVCIFGRNTLESIIDMNGKPLPNRTNIVLTRNKKYQPPKGVFVYHSVEQVLKEYENNGNDLDLYICGGSEVYKAFLPYSDRIILTVIHHEFNQVDSYFPNVNWDDWKIIKTQHNDKDESNSYDHLFIEYKRK